MDKDWKTERKKRMEEFEKYIGNAGKGLYEPQIEVEVMPWRINWQVLGMVMERQEEIIRLLGEMNAKLDGCGGRASGAPSKEGIMGSDNVRLRSMCKAAGLGANGDKNTLKRRLFKHYKLI